MPEQKQKLQTNLKNLLDEISFKSKKKKLEWLELIEYMDIEELKEACNHFKNRKTKEREIKLKLIVKYGLEDAYSKGIAKLSKMHIQKTKNKENKN